LLKNTDGFLLHRAALCGDASRGDFVAAGECFGRGGDHHYPFRFHLGDRRIPGVRQFNTYNHRALCAWIFCMLVMIIVSLLTAPPPKEKTEASFWNNPT